MARTEDGGVNARPDSTGRHSSTRTRCSPARAGRRGAQRLRRDVAARAGVAQHQPGTTDEDLVPVGERPGGEEALTVDAGAVGGADVGDAPGRADVLEQGVHPRHGGVVRDGQVVVRALAEGKAAAGLVQHDEVVTRLAEALERRHLPLCAGIVASVTPHGPGSVVTVRSDRSPWPRRRANSLRRAIGRASALRRSCGEWLVHSTRRLKGGGPWR